MMFTIGSIQWPKNSSSAIRWYLRYLLQVLDALKINFSEYPNDPIHITTLFLKDMFSEEERRHATKMWWNYIDNLEALREFQDKDILMGRLAICLLTVSEKDIDQLGENLSWFLEVLGLLGQDVDKAVAMMEVYFKPEN